eukprot:ANDGO_04399.mRNA.1 hypothetical protein GUITHDRAFT_163395
MAGLPREILKWLQSLDLSYSVKNVKRDFSNGFLVAEIFSRYFPSDVQMHSFDNGIALKKRLDNWTLLYKFFRKRGIDIDWTECESVVHSKPDAAVPFIAHVYSILTNKQIQIKPPSFEAEVDVPAFALPTASTTVKAALTNSELASHPDNQYAPQRSAVVLGEHYQQLKNEKARDPQRFTPQPKKLVSPTGAAAATTGINNSKSAGATSPQSQSYGGIHEHAAGTRSPQTGSVAGSDVGSDSGIQFKEVQVKRLDGGLSQLRAARELSTAAKTSQGSSGGTQPSKGGPTSGNFSAEELEKFQALSVVSNGSSAANASSVLVWLNRFVEAQLLKTEDIKILDPAKDTMVAFFESAGAEDLPVSSVNAVFASMESKIGQLADMMLSSPKEFFRAMSVLTSAFQFAATSNVFLETVELLIRLGQESVRRSPVFAWKLFQEFGLPSFAHVMKRSASKRHSLLRVFHSFVSEDVESQMTSIQALQDVLQDGDAFLHSLSLLSHVTLADLPRGSRIPEKLLDLFLYYAIIGMESASPILRASSLSMLPAVAHESPAHVFNLFGKLGALSHDMWWEVQAQLGTIYAALVLSVEDTSRHAEISSQQVEMLAQRVSDFLSSVSHPLAVQIALSELASCVSNNSAVTKSVSHAYVEKLLEIPESLRVNLFTDSPLALPLVTPPMCPYGHLSGVLTRWHPIAVCEALVSVVKAEQRENLEVEHMQILRAALRMETQPAETTLWGKVYDDLKYYLFAALCDPMLSAISAESLVVIFDILRQYALQSLPTLVSSLKLIFRPDSDPDLLICQEIANQFLVTLLQRGEPFSDSLRAVAKKLPEEVARSPKLREFMSLCR